jgi:hypothetical protein
MVGSHERLYVHERPLPTPVAEAVRHALFAPRPKPRYLVGSKKEVEITIDRLLTTLRQLNEKQAHSISKAELVAKLEKKLG